MALQRLFFCFCLVCVHVRHRGWIIHGFLFDSIYVQLQVYGLCVYHSQSLFSDTMVIGSPSS